MPDVIGKMSKADGETKFCQSVHFFPESSAISMEPVPENFNPNPSFRIMMNHYTATSNLYCSSLIFLPSSTPLLVIQLCVEDVSTCRAKQKKTKNRYFPVSLEACSASEEAAFVSRAEYLCCVELSLYKTAG